MFSRCSAALGITIKEMFSQNHRYGMCPSFPVPQNHIFTGFVSLALLEAEVNWILQ